MHYIIVFENPRFGPSSRKRGASVFQKSSLWRAFLEKIRFQGMRVNDRPNRRKKLAVFKLKRICVDEA